METVRVNDNGQFTMSPMVMKELGITKGEEFKIIKRDNHFIMMQ